MRIVKLNSKISFKDAVNDNNGLSFGATLDTHVKDKISSYNPGLQFISNVGTGGPIFSIILNKYSNNYYEGILLSYINYYSVEFKSANGAYDILFIAPQ